MLGAGDIYNIRYDTHAMRNDYREVVLVYPILEEGSNYEPFTDSPYDISKNRAEYATPTFKVYRIKARIKIVQDTSLLGLGSVVPGLEVGDYLLYFSDRDYATVDQVYRNKDGYIVVDGITFRMNNLTYNGVGQVFDVTAHCKKYNPRFRAEGL